MKRLVLVRHGKSSWKYDVPDDKRPLKKRGYKDAGVITSTFSEFFTPPALMWSSPAIRAHETAKQFKEALSVAEDNFEIKEELYTFDELQLLESIKSCPEDIEQLIVFGHNPAMTRLVNRLGDKPLDNLPTTGLCVIDFQNRIWSDIEKGKTILTLLPKDLR